VRAEPRMIGGASREKRNSTNESTYHRGKNAGGATSRRLRVKESKGGNHKNRPKRETSLGRKDGKDFKVKREKEKGGAKDPNVLINFQHLSGNESPNNRSMSTSHSELLREKAASASARIIRGYSGSLNARVEEKGESVP